MVVTMQDIEDIFHRLTRGEITREEADRWAWKRIEANDWDTLSFEPECDKELLWAAILYLNGVDMQIAPNEYMHTLEGIGQTFTENWEGRGEAGSNRSR